MLKKPSIIKLTALEVSERLRNLNTTGEWRLTTFNQVQAIEREMVLKDFESTWAFLTKIAMRAHLMGHHPTLRTTYRNVSVLLQSHDVGGLSAKDFKLANKINSYLADSRTNDV